MIVIIIIIDFHCGYGCCRKQDSSQSKSYTPPFALVFLLLYTENGKNEWQNTCVGGFPLHMDNLKERALFFSVIKLCLSTFYFYCILRGIER